jgi:hypothetical protein
VSLMRSPGRRMMVIATLTATVMAVLLLLFLL